MLCFVTGGAGFIGSNLVNLLLQEGHEVIAYDNLSTGFKEFLVNAEGNPKFRFIAGDLLDCNLLSESLQGCDFVYHLAANADIRFGTAHPGKDLEQNTIATFNLLEAMRAHGIRRIAFASTSAIYGEAKIFPTPEDAPLPIQTSLYGASKLAAEGLIQAYCEGFDFQAWIFRFVSVLGEHYPHGHVFDFYKKLLADPSELYVLGDGHQKKSYLYVQDCVAAIQTAVQNARDQVNIFNLGVNEYCEVNESIGWITEYLGLHPALKYSGEKKGWIGDSPFVFLDTARICRLGWRPKLSIKEAVLQTLSFLEQNRWLLEKR
jgi:UDP-glucose 4-epimerase